MRALALLLALLALAPAASASWNGLPRPGELFPEGSAERGIVEALEGGAPYEVQDIVTTSCGGTAPLTTSCAQDVNIPGGSTVDLYLKESTGFTGTILGSVVDRYGNFRTVTCTYFVFVGDVTAPPNCSTGGSDTPMLGGTMRLLGSVADVSGSGAPAPAPAVGSWEVVVEIR